MELPINDNNFICGGINEDDYEVSNVLQYQGQFNFEQNIKEIANTEFNDKPLSSNPEIDETHVYQESDQHFENAQYNLDQQIDKDQYDSDFYVNEESVSEEDTSNEMYQHNLYLNPNQQNLQPNANQQISEPNDNQHFDNIEQSMETEFEEELTPEELASIKLYEQMYQPDAHQQNFQTNNYKNIPEASTDNLQQPMDSELKEEYNSEEVTSAQIYQLDADQQSYQTNDYQSIPEASTDAFQQHIDNSQQDIDNYQQPMGSEVKEEINTEDLTSTEMYQQTRQQEDVHQQFPPPNANQQNHQSNAYQEINQPNNESIGQPFNNAQQPMEYRVKEEPPTEMLNSTQPYPQTYAINIDNWQQMSGNNPQYPQVKTEPTSENETPKYEQISSQNMNNFQPPFGYFQPNLGFMPQNPYNFPAFNPGLVPPHQAGQQYPWNSYWNNYSNFQGNGFPGQQGWPQYNPQQNPVKTEPGLSNDETSDLGSSFNSTGSSEDSFDFNDKLIRPDQDVFDWVPDDKILPKGWKKRVYKSGKPYRHHFFLSPTNQKFTSKAALIEYMEMNPQMFTKEDVDKIKTINGVKVRKYTNWDNSDSTLPQGWFKRHYTYTASDGKPITEYQYLSPDKQTFTSRNAVVAYMETSNFYTEEHIRMVLSGKVRRRSEYEAKKASSGASISIRAPIRDYSEWDGSDATLPKGWVKRYYNYKAPDGRCHTEYQYLSPNQEKFNSRNAIVAFMSTTGTYSEDDIQLVLSGKGRSNGRRPSNKKFSTSTNARDYSPWDDSDETLPVGWLKRHSDYKYPDGRLHKEYQFLSPEKHKFCSRNMAAAYMKSSGLYSEDVIGFFLSGKGKK